MRKVFSLIIEQKSGLDFRLYSTESKAIDAFNAYFDKKKAAKADISFDESCPIPMGIIRDGGNIIESFYVEEECVY